MIIHKNKKRLLRTIIPIAILLAVVGGMGWYVFAKQQPATKAAQTPVYSGPTTEEKNAGEAQKEAIIQRDKAISAADGSTSNGTKTVANVVITSANYNQNNGDQVQIRAYVNNVYEDGGSCEAMLTQGTQTVTVSGSPFKDVSYTQCGPMNIPRSQFPSAGQWQVVVKYSSSTADGESSPITVTI